VYCLSIPKGRNSGGNQLTHRTENDLTGPKRGGNQCDDGEGADPLRFVKNKKDRTASLILLGKGASKGTFTGTTGVARLENAQRYKLVTC